MAAATVSDDLGDPDWSSLPLDVLCSILHRLTLSDFLRCSAVFSFWSTATHLCRPKPHAPWLMLPVDGSSSRCHLFSLSDQKRFRIDLPEIQGHRLIGSSSDGAWVVTLDPRCELHAFNPFSKALIDLPSITTFSDLIVDTVLGPDGTVSGYIFDDSHDIPPHFMGIDFFLDVYYVKVIIHFFAPDDYVAVAIYGGAWMGLAFAQPGDTAWRIPDPELSGCYDVVFHKGQFYGLSCRGIVGAYNVADRHGRLLQTFVGPIITWDNLTKYFVESSGRLLQIWRHIHYLEEEVIEVNSPEDETEYPYQTNLFEIFSLDMESDVPKWNAVKSLGDQALFLGHNYSVSLTAALFPELRPNCIYFTDNEREYYLDARRSPRDMGVYDLGDGSIRPFFPHASDFIWPPPIWITPRLF